MTDKISDQISATDEILSKLSNLDPTCIVAGGAPHSWRNKTLARDVDIFMYFRPDLQHSVRVKLLEETLNIELDRSMYDTIRDEDIKGLYVTNPDIVNVFNFAYKSTDFQLILMRQPTFYVVERFPLNMNQIWYKTSHGIVPSRYYMKGEENKVLFKMNNAYANSDNFISKTKEKFKDYAYFEDEECAMRYAWHPVKTINHNKENK